MIKIIRVILIFLAVILLLRQRSIAQVDFNKRPDGGLGNVKYEFQEHFFEALKQKDIENYDRAVLQCTSKMFTPKK